LLNPPDLRSDPLYLKVYALLKGWIMEGRLSPGERLRETVLADQLQVSRTPVRDALRRLEQDRLIVAAPGPAYEVYRPTEQDLADLYSARSILEGGAARLAAGRRPPEVEEMALVLAEMARSYDEQPQQRVLDLDMRFHELLMAAAGNPVLVELHSHLTTRLRLVRSMSGDITVRRHQVLEQHRRIVEALRSGEGEAAAREVRQHIMTVYEIARQAFAERSAQGR
jgi:DNA-binding GntR family transcriptional regulator